ncbi:hypothetical protein RB597_006138 [Gaeumannomyces tritici]
MRFGKTLRQATHAPWKDKYIDYTKLKSLLREDRSEDDDEPWTEEDERRFGDELLNNQLEKVARFQEETFNSLRERVDAALETLKDLGSQEDESSADTTNDKGKGKEEDVKPGEDASLPRPRGDIPAERLRRLEAELDQITNEVKELKTYSTINYTGFLKIVKKHDRKRGERYKIRPIMQARLAQRPFNSEQGYTPLLRKLSLMYFAIRQHLEDGDAATANPADVGSASQAETHNGEKYTAHKFWVHPDNLLEVKTYILRRLPALVYSQQSAKEVDGFDDPRLSSLYFDNSKFDLFNKKLDQHGQAASLRLRWFGQLTSRPDIFLEQKMVGANGTSEERKFVIKEKYIKAFLDGDYAMEKSVEKMERQGRPAEEIEEFKLAVGSIREFVAKEKLQPLLRANYVRTAFQKPADDRVRISIDTELVFIREDVLDPRHPCRDPDDWHRRDIDNRNLTYPFRDVNPSEISRFPHAVLEIKLREMAGGKSKPAWVEDLMASHLVHPVPRFSKFAHGVASLFDDYVNALPFWLSDLEGDIRKDPQTAFLAEEQRRAERAEDEMVVGSFLGASGRMGSFKPAVARSSPLGKSLLAERVAAEGSRSAGNLSSSLPGGVGARRGSGAEDDDATAVDEQHQGPSGQQHRGYGTLSSVLPAFSTSRLARAKRDREAAAQLPEGVVEPVEWLKNSGPLRIEPKVWLANERTFLKWQHISVLLGTLAVALYTAAASSAKGPSRIAEWMGGAYLAVAALAGAWGYYTLRKRRAMIVARSGKDFDDMAGPLVVSVALMLALILNFFFSYQAALERWDRAAKAPGTGVNVTAEPGELRI